MCGICGIVTAHGEEPDPRVLHRMASQIVHRGPDDEGVIVSGRAGIAARRLSIIDLVGGHQPIPNEDGTVWCALNGEIYNHPELMDDLKKRGHVFRSRCDTEVIVHLYEEYGLGFLDKLKGMFALVVWDNEQDRVVLGRDPLGIKPLYYARVGDRLLFGSELKALLPAGLPRDLDVDALDAFLTLTYIPAPYTIFQAARKLRPGHYLLMEEASEPREERYWQLPLPEPGGRQSAGVDELSDELLRLLRAAVKRHMISDVPLGAFLSGGLDSSTVVALMAEQSSLPVRTFSIGFEQRSYDETPHARLVAQSFGAEHHELIQKPDPFVLVERLSWMYDEPFADSSAVATYAVADLARQHVTVALTGDGGDEIFGGYLMYQAHQAAEYYRRLPGVLRDSLIPWGTRLLPSSDKKTSLDFKAKRFARAASRPTEEAHLGWKTIFHPEVRAQLLPLGPTRDTALDEMRSHFLLGPVNDRPGAALYVDTLFGLPDDMLTKVDRATMAVSLEARVPLLDRDVVEFMARLPTSTKIRGWQLKYLLKHAVRDLLPATIMKRKKEGFNVPIAAWLRGELRDFTQDILSPSRMAATGVLDPATVQTLIQEHLSGRVDRGRELWSLLTFSLWYDHYMDGQVDVTTLTGSGRDARGG